MTTTLQQALINAGLASKNKIPERRPEKKTLLKPQAQSAPSRTAPSKPAPPRPAPAPRVEKKHEHHLRTDCEVCKKSGPDVEFYEHTNRILNVKWMCVKCADSYNIPDQCRQTKQSQFSQGGRFRREYGATKVFK